VNLHVQILSLTNLNIRMNLYANLREEKSKWQILWRDPLFLRWQSLIWLRNLLKFMESEDSYYRVPPILSQLHSVHNLVNTNFHIIITSTPRSPHVVLSLEVFQLNLIIVRAIWQDVTRRLRTAAARVRAQVSSSGICGGQSDTEVGFLRVLRFAVPILIPPTAPHSSSIIRGWYNRPVSGRRTKSIESHPTPRN
jgi:hypothetical protein